MRGSTPSLGRTRSSSNARPNHIALPSNNMSGAPGETPPLASPSSPRSSFLPSFMQRTRPRSSTLTRLGSYNNTNGNGTGNTSTSPGHVQPPQASSPGASSSRPGMERTASGNVGNDLGRTVSQPAVAPPASDAPVTTFRIRLVPHLETYRSVHFEPIVRDLKPCDNSDNPTGLGTVVKIGRFTERPATAPQPAPSRSNGFAESTSMDSGAAWMGAGGGGDVTAPLARDLATTELHRPVVITTPSGAGGGGALTSNKVAFRSKVVSRAHAEFWVEAGGQFYIRDTHSSSGTFLNHIRLSNPTQESRPFSIKDGDIIQLGVDYQGGTEEMYRCIKMKVEVGREKRKQNNFNKEAMKQLKALGGVPDTPTSGESSGTQGKPTIKASVTDCCICLFSVTVQQALFIAPCSHVFHYKCIRPILEVHHPGFSCPLCRTFHDLEADVELEDAWEVASRRASVATGRRASSQVEAANGDSESAPAVPIITTSESDSDVQMDREQDREQNQSQEQEHEREGHTSDSPSHAISSGRPNMSLGALPIPSVGGPVGNGNPDYAGLDAATPMNHTFLSTLADTPNRTDAAEARRPLDNVAEDESAEHEVFESTPGMEHMYT